MFGIVSNQINTAIPCKWFTPDQITSDIKETNTKCLLMPIDKMPSLSTLDSTLSSPIYIYVNKTIGPPLIDLIKTFKSFKYLFPVLDENQIDLYFNDKTKLDIGEIIFRLLDSDRLDNLIPTIVSNELGLSLGLVYSSAQSISESIKTESGVYQSRKRGLWYKGKKSGATQKLLKINIDCDSDSLQFIIEQSLPGFCHLERTSCFGDVPYSLQSLVDVLIDRKTNSPPDSYTMRLYNDSNLLHSKILEEANELCAENKEEIASEAADVFYFALVKCVSNGVSLNDINTVLEKRSKSTVRRPGNAKPEFVAAVEALVSNKQNKSVSDPTPDPSPKLLKKFCYSDMNSDELKYVLKRPIFNSRDILNKVQPIIDQVKHEKDKALERLTLQFDKIKLNSLVLNSPFPKELMTLPIKVKEAIDTAYQNIHKFHYAQLDQTPLIVETMPGVTCSRICQSIQSVGLYIPGGSAVLPSTALMLGIPAQVAGCESIIISTPPNKSGEINPEIVYIAHLVGAKLILKVGGAQAIAALAYGTESCPKVDKICGPGNQYVTAAKMIVQNDNKSLVSIDMPAGPSEVMVICDGTSPVKYIVSDLLSQAEHGPDSQVILIKIGDSGIQDIYEELEKQLDSLPRCDISRKALLNSRLIVVSSVEEAIEHLILHVTNASKLIPKIKNAGSVFVGPFTPESCGDYASGTNHTLPTYGYAKSYSGVSTSTFLKYMTCQEITPQGLGLIGPTVMILAEREELIGHKNAVLCRLEDLENGWER